MPHLGLKCTFITGILFVSLWNIIFGFLPWIHNTTIFVLCCFVCRIGMALGIVALNQAIFVIVALTWPEEIAFRLSTVEVAVSIGTMSGMLM